MANNPYVNKVDNPSKNFPRGMIALASMVVVCAILGTIALGMMFDPAVIGESDATFNSYVSNGAYWAFQKVGQYYGVGDFFLVIYAICNAIGQFSTLILSIDAPLRILLGNDYAKEFIPSAMLKQNKHGAYINGIKLVVVLSGAIIPLPFFPPVLRKIIEMTPFAAMQNAPFRIYPAVPNCPLPSDPRRR